MTSCAVTESKHDSLRMKASQRGDSLSYPIFITLLLTRLVSLVECPDPKISFISENSVTYAHIFCHFFHKWLFLHK